MTSSKKRNPLATALVATLCLVVATAPLPAAEQGSAPGSSVLAGSVTAADGAAVVGATVVAYHLSSEQVFRSAPTDGKGNFTISGLPYGYFDVAVDSASGLFVADVVINAAPSGKTVVRLDLAAGSSGTPRRFPGTDTDPTGVAHVDRKAGSGKFWRGPKGIGIIAGLGGVALLALASGGNGNSNNDASPSGL